MRNKMVSFLYLSVLCILFAGCSLQRDTFEIIYATPTTLSPATSTSPTTTEVSTTTTPTNSDITTVWVSTKGGTKYHNKSDCSSMTEAASITLEAATEKGYTPCKRCFKDSDT